MEAYIKDIKVSHVHIKEVDDELVRSKNLSLEIYTLRLGYRAMSASKIPKDSQWWWKRLWKNISPLKSIIFT